jgi:SH3 domain
VIKSGVSLTNSANNQYQAAADVTASDFADQNSLIDSNGGMDAPRPLRSRDDSVLYQAVLSNQILVPQNVNLPIQKTQADQGDPAFAVEPFAVEAMYEFTAELDDEIGFGPGEIIMVTHIGGRSGLDGWWYGRLEQRERKSGWFPSEYCKMC